MKERYKKLQEACDKKSDEMNDLLLKLTETKDKLSKYVTRNVTKKMKRRDDKITDLENRLTGSTQVLLCLFPGVWWL